MSLLGTSEFTDASSLGDISAQASLQHIVEAGESLESQPGVSQKTSQTPSDRILPIVHARAALHPLTIFLLLAQTACWRIYLDNRGCDSTGPASDSLRENELGVIVFLLPFAAAAWLFSALVGGISAKNFAIIVCLITLSVGELFLPKLGGFVGCIIWLAFFAPCASRPLLLVVFSCIFHTLNWGALLAVKYMGFLESLLPTFWQQFFVPGLCSSYEFVATRIYICILDRLGRRAPSILTSVVMATVTSRVESLRILGLVNNADKLGTTAFVAKEALIRGVVIVLISVVLGIMTRCGMVVSLLRQCVCRRPQTFSKSFDVYLRTRYAFAYATVCCGVVFGGLSGLVDRDKRFAWNIWVTWVLFIIFLVGRVLEDCCVLALQGREFRMQTGCRETLIMTYRRLWEHGGHHAFSCRSYAELKSEDEPCDTYDCRHGGWWRLSVEHMTGILIMSFTLNIWCLYLLGLYFKNDC